MKKRPGDRRDGKLLRELDSLHFVTGVLYPNRCDNEAYISICAELEPIKKYVEKKSAEDPDFKYTFFHVIVASLIKTITLREKMNRFIVNGNFYQRNEVSASFVVKKEFSDKGEEGLAFVRAKEGQTITDIHEDIKKQVRHERSGQKNSTDSSLDLMNKLPRWISKTAIRFIMWLDKHGWVPKSMIVSDPYYSSVVISNLGSIKLKCGYHHLTNWGTCSMFCIIGEKHLKNIINADGTNEVKEVIDLGLTIDERIADGYYYSKTVKLLSYLLAHPEELEKPFEEEVDYE